MLHDCVEHAHEIGGVVAAAEGCSYTVLNGRLLPVLQRVLRSSPIFHSHGRLVLSLRQLLPVDRDSTLQNTIDGGTLTLESAITVLIHGGVLSSPSLEYKSILLSRAGAALCKSA